MRVQGQLGHPPRAQRHEVSSLLVGIAFTPGAKGTLKLEGELVDRQSHP